MVSYRDSAGQSDLANRAKVLTAGRHCHASTCAYELERKRERERERER